MDNFIQKAKELGCDHGRSEARLLSVVECRVLSHTQYANNAVLDMPRSPLSGEFADDMTPQKLYEAIGLHDEKMGWEYTELYDEICNAYEDAYEEAWWDELSHICDNSFVEKTLNEAP